MLSWSDLRLRPKNNQAVSDVVFLARVGRPLGLKGWFYLQGRKDPLPSDFSSLLIKKDSQSESLGQQTPWKPIRILDCRLYKDQVIALTDLGCSRSAIEPWRGASIGAPAQQRASKPEEGVVYWDDLKGRQVATADGVLLGTIDHIYCAGASDVAAIQGAYSVDIPLVDDFIDIRKISKNLDLRVMLEVSKEHILPLVNGLSEPQGTVAVESGPCP